MFRIVALSLCFVLNLCLATLSLAQTSPPPLIGLGDSLGEGVQSADANQKTQPNGHLNLIATQMGVPFPLPLIKTSPRGVVGSTTHRSRIDPSLGASNLAVSGADSTSILNDVAGTPIDGETDLVLGPRMGTQISIAQSLQSPFMICWIGNNDALGAVIDFNHLNASQLTPVPVFQANIRQIVQTLTAWNAKVTFANIPDVAQIGFLFTNQDLLRFLGNDYGLPDGSYTSLVAMLLIKTGINDGSILRNPNWVLDATEAQTIRDAVTAYNQIIAQEAAQAGMPVVDINELFREVAQNPPVIGNVTLTPRYLGGLFSLDGVHASDIGYAIIANAFIATINSFFATDIPEIGEQALESILQADPFVDFNGNLRVRGRPFNGLLETLGPVLGISGDLRDGRAVPGVDKTLGPKFMRAYFAATGRDPNTRWTKEDAVQAFRSVFGVDHFLGK
jgi:phospholipase/lecithinase/hemolysin